MPHNYFDEQIQAGKPIIPPAESISPSLANLAPNEAKKGLPVRAEGDKIFLLANGQRRWITSAEVYERLGFKFGDEKEIDLATLNVIPEGEPIR